MNEDKECRSADVAEQLRHSGNGTTAEPEMLEEYDFSQGVRGKCADRFNRGTNIVLLSPDVAAVFPDADSVNEALRTLVQVANRSVKKVAGTV